jgi:hypothetical protein
VPDCSACTSYAGLYAGLDQPICCEKPLVAESSECCYTPAGSWVPCPQQYTCTD